MNAVRIIQIKPRKLRLLGLKQRQQASTLYFLQKLHLKRTTNPGTRSYGVDQRVSVIGDQRALCR